MFVKGIHGGFEEAKEGAELASKIYEIAKRDVLSPVYVEELKKLEVLLPDAVETLYFYGILALNQGNKDIAEKILIQAWEKRKLDSNILYSLSCIYEPNKKQDILPWLHYLLASFVNLKDKDLKKLGLYERAQHYLCVSAVPMIKEEDNLIKPSLYASLPYGNLENEFPYRAGIYNELDFPGRSFIVMERITQKSSNAYSLYGDIDFDIIRMEEKKSTSLNVNKVPCIVYLLASNARQTIDVLNKNGKRVHLPLYAFETRPIRLNENAQLKSAQPFAMSKPIFLQHAKNRRKLVLNILVDGLAWAKQKQLGYVDVPYIQQFFREGVIFDNNFSTAEYTYPSLASIETGMHAHNSQLFRNDCYMELSPQIQTLSERMTQLGYYSVALMADGEILANGVGRGYARCIINSGIKMQVARGIDRLFRHIEAFKETDNFVFLHVCDTHPYSTKMIQPLESSMTHYSLEDFPSDDGQASVFLSANPLAAAANRENIRRVDQFLGALFDYIHKHYCRDEVMINLYSDHGFGVYDNDWLLADNHVGAALMCYGGGVPVLGHVDELTSNLDLYKIMGCVLGFPADMNYLDGKLPKVFGGKGHEYVITNSIYPGQTYKLAIRTKEHEFRLETKDLTSDDGTVDMSDFVYRILDRKTHEDVEDSFLANYFLAIAKQHTKPFWCLLG